MSTFADSTGLSTFPSANADRPRAAPGGRHFAAMLVPEPLRHEERRVGNDSGRMMHDRVLHMDGRKTRGVSSVLPSCPDLFRASTSLRRLAHSRRAPRCRKTWMPGTSPGMTIWERTGRRARQRKGAPASPAPPLSHYEKYTPKRVPSQEENACSGHIIWQDTDLTRFFLPSDSTLNPAHARFRRDFPPLPGGERGRCCRLLGSSSPLPLAGGVGGGWAARGTDRIDRQRKRGAGISSRRPHFPIVGNMGRFVSRVKSIFLF